MALTNDDSKAIANFLQPIQSDIHMTKDNIMRCSSSRHSLISLIDYLKKPL